MSRRLIREARQVAATRQANVEFDVGSMCSLPYDDESFNVILALWSAFFELLERSEQIRAIGNMYRVLRPGGWALFEGPVYSPPTKDEIAQGKRYGPEFRIAVDEVNGMSRPGFRHNSDSFRSLMEEAGIVRHECYVGNWAGRERLFLRFCKV